VSIIQAYFVVGFGSLVLLVPALRRVGSPRISFGLSQPALAARNDVPSNPGEQGIRAASVRATHARLRAIAGQRRYTQGRGGGDCGRGARESPERAKQNRADANRPREERTGWWTYASGRAETGE